MCDCNVLKETQDMENFKLDMEVRVWNQNPVCDYVCFNCSYCGDTQEYISITLCNIRRCSLCKKYICDRCDKKIPPTPNCPTCRKYICDNCDYQRS